MGLFNHFPYPDTHQLNLDWILDAVKTCVDKVTELWTYVREPGAGIQKALTDAQASAEGSQTSAISAQASAEVAQESVTQARASATTAKTSATSAQESAANAQDSATIAINSASACQEYLESLRQVVSATLYPVGSLYVNYRNQELTAESDATVIARLKALTGGTWARAGSHGQPVTASDKLGWATVILGDGAGQANDTNFNIYVRTA